MFFEIHGTFSSQSRRRFSSSPVGAIRTAHERLKLALSVEGRSRVVDSIGANRRDADQRCQRRVIASACTPWSRRACLEIARRAPGQLIST